MKPSIGRLAVLTMLCASATSFASRWLDAKEVADAQSMVSTANRPIEGFMKVPKSCTD